MAKERRFRPARRWRDVVVMTTDELHREIAAKN
jgi:hypothetical protein